MPKIGPSSVVRRDRRQFIGGSDAARGPFGTRLLSAAPLPTLTSWAGWDEKLFEIFGRILNIFRSMVVVATFPAAI